MKWIFGLLSAFALILVVLLSPLGKQLLRSAFTRWATSVLGAEVELQELDYRLWRGELIFRELHIAQGVENPPVLLDAREITLRWTPFRGISLSVKDPHLKLLQAPGTPEAEAGGEISIPAGLAAVTMTNGTFQLSRRGEEPWLEMSSIDFNLISREDVYEGSIQSSSGRAERFSFGGLQAQFEFHGGELAIKDAIVEEGTSRIQARGNIPSFSPLLADLDLEFDLDVRNLQMLQPEMVLAGRLQGKANALVDSTGLHVESQFDSPTLESPVFGRWEVNGEIALENTLLLDVRRLLLRGYGGEVEAKGRFDFARQNHSLEIAFSRMEIPQLSAIWAKQSLPIASRADGNIKLDLAGGSLEGANGSGRISFSPSPSEIGIPLTGEIDFATASGAARFQTRRLSIPNGAIEIRGDFNQDGSMKATYTAQLQEFRRLDPLLLFLEIPTPPPELRGGVSFQGEVDGDLFRPSTLNSNLTLSSDHLIFHGKPFGLDVNMRLADKRLALDAKVEGLDLSEVTGDLGGLLQGDLRATGDPLDPDLSAQLEVSHLRIRDMPGTAHLNVRKQKRQLFIENLEIELGNARGRAAGRYHLDSGEIAARVDAGGLHLKELAPADTGLDGIISSLGADIEGVFPTFRGRADFSIEELMLRGTELPSLVVEARSDGDVARMDVRLSDGPILAETELELETPFPLRVSLDLSALPLDELLPALFPSTPETTRLRAHGRLDVSFPLTRPTDFQFRANVEQMAGLYRGIGGGTGSPFVIEGDRSSVTIVDLNLVGTDTAIEIDGTISLTADGDLDLTLLGNTRLELANAFLGGAELSGDAVLELYLGGSASSPDPMGEMVIENGSGEWNGLRADDLEMLLEAGDRNIRLRNLEAALLGGRVHLAGIWPIPRPKPSEPARLDFELSGLDLAELQSTVEPASLRPRLRVSARGSIEATDLSLTAISGSGDLLELGAGLGELELQNEGTASWSLENNHFTLPRLRMAAEQTDLEVALAATLSAAEPSWSASFRGRWDNALLAPLIPDAGNILLAGTTLLDFEVRSSEEGPLFSGGASLEKSRLVVLEPALVFSNIEGQARFQGRSIHLSELEADVGGGKVAGSGKVELTFPGGLSHLDLRMDADSVRLAYPEGMRSTISGLIELSGEPGDLLLSGDMRLLQALFRRDFTMDTELLSSMEHQSVAWTEEESFSETVRLNLRVRTVEDLHIDSNLAQVQANADLRATGTVAFPEIDGVLTARPDGTLHLGRNTYRIESGRLLLQGYPTEPAELDLTAKTSVGSNEILIRLSGKTDNVKMELSTPNPTDLSQGDLASLLVLGRTLEATSGPKSISSQNARRMGEQLASYLSGRLANLVQQGLAEALPFDQVTVGAAQIGSEVDPEIRFTLGKAVSDELFLTYSIGLNDAQKQLWIVDYELPQRFAFRATRQEDNKFNTSLSHELQLDFPGRPERPERMKRQEKIATVRIEGAPPELEDVLRDKVGFGPSDSYDYWKSQDDVERLTQALRRMGYLGAVVGVESRPAGESQVDVTYLVTPGTLIRIHWEGDDPGKRIQRETERQWDGRQPESSLLLELAAQAQRNLQTKGYFQARVTASATQSGDGARDVSFLVHQGPPGKKISLEFEGNQALTDQELRSAMPPTSSTDFYELIFQNTNELRQRIRLQYASRGYLQARVDDPRFDYEVTTGVNRILIPVEEGFLSKVSQIDFEGAEAVNQDQLRRDLRVNVGQPFRLSDIAQDRSTLASIYRREGFVEARVRGQLKLTDTGVDVVYYIEEGPPTRVGNIRIVGNHATHEATIRRQLTFQKGDPLRLSALTDTQRRLYDLGVFRSVDVRMEPAPDGSAERDVVVEVEETADIDINYGLRFSTEDRFEILASLQFPNLLGSAQNLALTVVANDNQTLFRPTYSTPYFWKYRLDSNVFLSRKTEEDDFFFNKAWEWTFQQTKRLRQSYNLQWSYTFKHTYTLGKIDTGPFPFEITARQSILTASLIEDRRDNLIQPTGGRFWNVTFQFAPEALGSEVKFVKLFGQLFTYVPIGENLIWASSYRIGIADAFDQKLFLDDRFRAGGATTVRGFAENMLGPLDPGTDSRIGGEGLFILNQEIRFPIYRWFQGVGFYDAGNVYLQASDFNPIDLRHSAGIGVRLALPFGLLRLDWARVLDPQPGEKISRFWFSLNHAF